MIINNGLVLGDDFEFHKGGVRFSQTVEEVGLMQEGLDVKGAYVLPGFFDIHTHGAIGHDAVEITDVEAHRDYMYQNGILNYFPTTISERPEALEQALKVWAEVPFIKGINLEGPFLNAEKRGAHREDYIREADLEMVYRFQAAAKNKIKITTIAPEVGCNLELIPKLRKMEIRVSLGHSTADFETAAVAFDNGASHVTHLFNAMNPLGHRSSGLAGAALDRVDVYCEIISDGVHLAPEIVRLVYKVKGSDRMVLISDSMAATGLKDGEYQLGGNHVTVLDGTARTDAGAIAGSTKNLRQMVKSAVSFGIPLEEAVKMASLTPAKAVGLDEEIGSIAPGKHADLVVADRDLSVKMAFKDGVLVYQSE